MTLKASDSLSERRTETTFSAKLAEWRLLRILFASMHHSNVVIGKLCMTTG